MLRALEAYLFRASPRTHVLKHASLLGSRECDAPQAPSLT